MWAVAVVDVGIYGAVEADFVGGGECEGVAGGGYLYGEWRLVVGCGL